MKRIKEIVSLFLLVFIIGILISSGERDKQNSYYWRQSQRFGDSVLIDSISMFKVGGYNVLTEESMVTGQEALDSLSANIGRTIFGSNETSKNSYFANGTAVTKTLDYNYRQADKTVLTNGRPLLVRHIFEKDTVITGFEFNLYTQGLSLVSTGFNGGAAYIFNSDSTGFTQIAVSSDDISIFEGTAHNKVYIAFTAPVNINAGTVYFAIQAHMTYATRPEVLDNDLTNIDSEMDNMGTGFADTYLQGTAYSTLQSEILISDCTIKTARIFVISHDKR